jgi:hypothetical protein
MVAAVLMSSSVAALDITRSDSNDMIAEASSWAEGVQQYLDDDADPTSVDVAAPVGYQSEDDLVSVSGVVSGNIVSTLAPGQTSAVAGASLISLGDLAVTATNRLGDGDLIFSGFADFEYAISGSAGSPKYIGGTITVSVGVPLTEDEELNGVTTATSYVTVGNTSLAVTAYNGDEHFPDGPWIHVWGFVDSVSGGVFVDEWISDGSEEYTVKFSQEVGSGVEATIGGDGRVDRRANGSSGITDMKDSDYGIECSFSFVAVSRPPYTPPPRPPYIPPTRPPVDGEE